MISYQEFTKILNKHIFSEQKRDLLITISENPERFVGLFRPTKPLGKILQHVLQSNEIKFGDAIEELLEVIIKKLNYKILDKNIKYNDEIVLKIDQYFEKDNVFYFIEQKIRDDHDSSKKRGQIKNFEEKLEFLYKTHRGNIVGILYFLDPSLEKNKNYYLEEIERLKNFYKVNIYLFYGKELFNFLNISEFWDEMLKWLKNWKNTLPDLPEVNFDKEPKKSFNEIKDLEIRYWRKLLENEQIWKEGIGKIIFPKGYTLNLLKNYFNKQSLNIYREITNKITYILGNFYSREKK